MVLMAVAMSLTNVMYFGPRQYSFSSKADSIEESASNECVGIAVAFPGQNFTGALNGRHKVIDTYRDSNS